jgi:hypothetical protein
LPGLNWWDAPEYDKRAPMVYPDDRDRARMARIGVSVEFDTALRRWVSTPIRVYVGTSHV